MSKETHIGYKPEEIMLSIQNEIEQNYIRFEFRKITEGNRKG